MDRTGTENWELSFGLLLLSRLHRLPLLAQEINDGVGERERQGRSTSSVKLISSQKEDASSYFPPTNYCRAGLSVKTQNQCSERVTTMIHEGWMEESKKEQV